MIVESYRIPIEFAVMLFPLIAFLFTLPFLIYQYRKYGAVPFFKGIIVYSFILYLLTAYLMVILPLPSIKEVAQYKNTGMQLEPFRFLNDIKVTTNLNLNDINSIMDFLNRSTVYTVLFNLLMTIPFGIYLRYFFKKKWWQTILWTFLLSLFFEITQLTGLYGIYPKPYRIFDVDDLIVNTMGGIVGFIITPILTMFFPTQEELNSKGYEKGKKVRLLRRFVAFVVDVIFLCLFTLIFRIILHGTPAQDYNFICAIFLYYIIIPTLNNTKTFGKVIIKLEVTSIEGKFSYLNLILRNFILAYFILYPFSWCIILSKYVPSILIYIIGIVIGAYELINIISYIIKQDGEHLFLYERMTNTKNISTLVREDFEKEKDNKETEED